MTVLVELKNMSPELPAGLLQAAKACGEAKKEKSNAVTKRAMR
jgi:hypothetical protein